MFRLLNLPVVLAIDCSHLSGSVAAIAFGYRFFDARIKLAGVILNRVGSDRHLELLSDALESLQLPILGVIRRQDQITIPDRHLGLVPVAEMLNLETIIDKIAHLGKECFNWELLLPLLKNVVSRPSVAVKFTSPIKVRIAIARDRAFSFYYQDNLDLLEQLGAELVFWSPLTDSALPEGVQGLYFGGGFPEVFAEQLSANRAGCDAIKSAIANGIPTYAECGGLMYLCQAIVDFNGKSWEMVGILPTIAVMSSRLILGYRQAVALQDSPLLSKGTNIFGHEFHRSHLSENSASPLLKTRSYSRQGIIEYEGWQIYQLHASYIHLHWGISPEIPTRFIQYCQG